MAGTMHSEARLHGFQFQLSHLPVSPELINLSVLPCVIWKTGDPLLCTPQSDWVKEWGLLTIMSSLDKRPPSEVDATTSTMPHPFDIWPKLPNSSYKMEAYGCRSLCRGVCVRGQHEETDFSVPVPLKPQAKGYITRWTFPLSICLTHFPLSMA